jgi:hypothetical protein
LDTLAVVSFEDTVAIICLVTMKRYQLSLKMSTFQA